MNGKDESWLREQFRRPNGDPPLLSGEQDDIDDLEGAGSVRGWLRLVVAVVCLGAAVLLTGERFVNYIVHHVWYHARNSPLALIVPILAVQFVWLVVHLQASGFFARLKIGLGAAVICMTIFAPSPRSLGGAAPRRPMDLRQLCALSLAAWVLVDGWRDRLSGLPDDGSHDLAGQRP
jgi:hypothetical protein